MSKDKPCLQYMVVRVTNMVFEGSYPSVISMTLASNSPFTLLRLGWLLLHLPHSRTSRYLQRPPKTPDPPSSSARPKLDRMRTALHAGPLNPLSIHEPGAECLDVSFHSLPDPVVLLKTV